MVSFTQTLSTWSAATTRPAMSRAPGGRGWRCAGRKEGVHGAWLPLAGSAVHLLLGLDAQSGMRHQAQAFLAVSLPVTRQMP